MWKIQKESLFWRFNYSTKAIFKAIDTIKSINVYEVPIHLKNNSTNYKNPHNYPRNCDKQEYLPKILQGLKIWEPGDLGWEKRKYDELHR